MVSVDSAADLLVALATGLAKAQSFFGLYDSRMVNAVVDTESVRRVDAADGVRLEASGTMRVRFGIEAEGEWSESDATEPVIYRVIIPPVSPTEQPPTSVGLIARFSGTHDSGAELRLRPADGRGPDLVATWKGNPDQRHLVFEVARQSRRH